MANARLSPEIRGALDKYAAQRGALSSGQEQFPQETPKPSTQAQRRPLRTRLGVLGIGAALLAAVGVTFAPPLFQQLTHALESPNKNQGEIQLVSEPDNIVAKRPGPRSGAEVELYPDGLFQLDATNGVHLRAQLHIIGQNTHMKGGIFLGNEYLYRPNQRSNMKRIILAIENQKLVFRYYDGATVMGDFSFVEELSRLESRYTDEARLTTGLVLDRQGRTVQVLLPTGEYTDTIDLQGSIFDANPNSKTLTVGVYSDTRTTTKLENLTQIPTLGI